MGQVVFVLVISQSTLRFTAQALELDESGIHWADEMCDTGQVT